MKKKIKNDLENHIYKNLHDNYSVNFNTNFTNCLTLLVTSLAVLAGYGYVFINSTNSFICDINTFTTCDHLYTSTAVLLATIAANIVITAMIIILIYQGFASRKEQAIAYAIRRKAGIKPRPSGEILPENYHPFNKGFFNSLPGLYKYIIIILIIFMILINIATAIRVGVFYFDNFGSLFLLYIFTLVSIVVCIALIIVWMVKKLSDYNDYIFKNYNDISKEG